MARVVVLHHLEHPFLGHAGEAALTTSLMIARAWNAHVTALHVRVDSRDVAPLAGEGLSGAMSREENGESGSALTPGALFRTAGGARMERHA